MRTNDRIFSVRRNDWNNFPWGEAIVKSVTDPDNVNHQTTYEYYDNNSSSLKYGLLKKQVSSSGKWTKYDYDSSKRRKSVVRPFMSSDSTEGDNAHRKTTYDYGQDALMAYTPEVTTDYLLGVVIGKTYHVVTTNNFMRTEIHERAATQNADFGDAGNLRTTTVYYPTNSASISAGKIHYIDSPGGLRTTWSYVEDAAGYHVVETQGTTASPDGIANKTTCVTNTWDASGNNIRSETFVYTKSGSESIGWTSRLFDELGHLTNEVNSAGMMTSADWANNCCGKESDTDASGLTTVFTYDDLQRIDIQERNLGDGTIITDYDYDLAGRRIRTTVQAGDIVQISSNCYDSADRLVYSLDTQGIGTTYQYSTNELTRTTIRAGITNSTVSYLDGRTHYTEQNAVRQNTYAYGVNPDGSQWTEVYTGKDALTSAIWQITTIDMLRRTIRAERPGFGGTTIVNQTFYNDDGTIARTTSTGQPDIYYFYNELGERIRTVQDVNNNTTIELAGPDRVNDTQAVFEKDVAGDWWQKSFQVLYPHNNATPVTNGINRTRLTGLGSSRTASLDGAEYTGLVIEERIAEDIRGNETVSQQLLNRDQKLSIGLALTPSSTLTNAAITFAGLQAKTISSTGIVTTNWYDSLGRNIMTGNLSTDVLQANPATIAELEAKVAASENRNTFSLTGYNAKGQVEWSRDAASNNTWYAYNDYGQRYATIRAVTQSAVLTTTQLANEAYIHSLVNNEDFSVSYTAYSPEGQVLATWGNAYPVAYEYDDQNRMIAMATTRDENLRSVNLLAQLPAGETLSTWQPAASEKIDITKWVYDTATGLLTDKVYADGYGPEYTYTANGRLSQRTWARGITTDYAYDFVGSLTNVVYNDSTPAVAYTYNRLGQQLSATSSISTNIFVYSSITLELDYELQNGAKIDRSADTLGRNAGYALFSSLDSVNPVQEIVYGYSDNGRFASVTSTNSQSSIINSQFTYSYLPGSDLLAGYTGISSANPQSQIQIQKSFELNRNLITTITNSVGSVPSVVSSFDYVNDTLGRRTARSDYYINRGSTEANTFGYNTFSEVTNANMGTNTYSYAYDPIGNRDQEVKNSLATDYTANGLNQYTNITGGLSGTPLFDLDGNMTFLPTNSGAGGEGWHCQWDAENRLLSASNLTTAVVCNFIYDHQSRRVLKTTLTPSTPSSSLTSKFTYDGWNLIYEQTSTNNSFFIPHNSSFYTWGLDLSGSLQGAGGVGGLLSVVKNPADLSAKAYYAMADANGNITEYLDDSGTVVAHYEYDAFGNTSTSSGDMVDDFVFRFSSKYLDEETGLYYYGYRYYDPVTGRWLTRDKIEEKGGLLLYGFLSNSVIDKTDLLGAKCASDDDVGAVIYTRWSMSPSWSTMTKYVKNEIISPWVTSVTMVIFAKCKRDKLVCKKCPIPFLGDVYFYERIEETHDIELEKRTQTNIQYPPGAPTGLSDYYDLATGFYHDIQLIKEGVRLCDALNSSTPSLLVGG